MADTQFLAQSALFGALLGDALGVPHEFKPADQIPPPAGLSLVMPADYPKTYPEVPYGTWSDDGSQMLCLLESLNAHDGRFELLHFVELLHLWRHGGHHQSGGQVFDIGRQTRTALDRWRDGLPVDISDQGQGNGSLMRTLPAALVCALWPQAAADPVDVAVHQSRATHPHPLPAACCAIYAQLATRLLDDPRQSLVQALEDAFEQVSMHPLFVAPSLQAALDCIWHQLHHEPPTGSSHCVDSLRGALWALERGSDYLGVVRSAISLGQDTDTTACIAGGLAAIRFGLGSVPASWWRRLRVPRASRLLLDAFFCQPQPA